MPAGAAGSPSLFGRATGAAALLKIARAPPFHDSLCGGSSSPTPKGESMNGNLAGKYHSILKTLNLMALNGKNRKDCPGNFIFTLRLMMGEELIL